MAQNVKGGYWFSDSGITASDINSALFIHLFCAFADSFAAFTRDVQQKNPSAVTLLSIGGGGNKSIADNIASMARQSSSRKSFIDSSFALARSNGFHGLDLDWSLQIATRRWPTWGGQLRQGCLLLSAAVHYSPHHWSNTNYPVAAMAASLDWINAVAYDFYAPGWSSTTGPFAALYNPDDGLSAWIQAGMMAEQIVLGILFYGSAFALADANNHGYFAPFTGPVISSEGMRMYHQITTYDDIQTICTKAAYTKGRGLKGYIAWHVAGDDNWVLSQAASASADIASKGNNSPLNIFLTSYDRVYVVLLVYSLIYN
ncbi:hypothetical protein ACJRO7_013472 [Eucalyptus globulus]|uniref:GH18 domain-containing protein n=1 Tax=Eucalyptus globulus TaxID=34317 RepID=A0ABD3L378_EUCGL